MNYRALCKEVRKQISQAKKQWTSEKGLHMLDEPLVEKLRCEGVMKSEIHSELAMQVMLGVRRGVIYSEDRREKPSS